MSIRHERDEEFIATALRRVGGGLRDVQRATGTEKARTMLAAQEALTSANGKSKVWFSSTPPPGVDHKVGDTWFDASNSNRINEWDGDDWVPVKLGENAIEDLAITNAKIANLDGGKIVAGSIDTLQLNADAIDGMTITGALIRTAATGQRLQFDINGLRAFNAAGAQTAVLFSESGALSLNGTLNVSEAGGNSSVSLRGPDGAIQCTRIISGLAASFVSGPTSSRVEAAAGYGGFSNGRAASIEVLQSRARLLLTTSTALGDKASSVAQNIDGDLEISSSGDITLDAGPGGKISLNAAAVEFHGDRPWARIDSTAHGSAIGYLGSGVTHNATSPYDGVQARIKGGVLYISGAITRAGGYPANHVLFTLNTGFRPGAATVQYAYAGGHNFIVAFQTDGTVVVAAATAGAGMFLGLTIPLG